MAKRQANPNGTNGARTSHLPEGFKKAQAEKAEYFVQPREGLTIRGQLLGRFPKRGAFPGFYYQIRVFEEVEDCTHKIGAGEYEDNATCPAGQILSIDEKGALQCLERQADGTQEVFIYCGSKRAIGGGKTAWDIEVGLRPFDNNSVPF